jgi:hypothetical protein
MTHRRPSEIRLADEKVPILAACQLIGMNLPDDIAYGRAVKVHCPFGELFHNDGGTEAAMRIYADSNHVYCFAGCGFFGPVGLVSHAFDITRRAAARELLARAGIRMPTPREVWDAATTHVEPPDTALLAEALKTFCRRTAPAWESDQYRPDVAERLTRCLGLLDHVVTPQAADQWLTACKTIMARVLAGQVTEPTPTPY